MLFGWHGPRVGRGTLTKISTFGEEKGRTRFWNAEFGLWSAESGKGKESISRSQFRIRRAEWGMENSGFWNFDFGMGDSG